MLLLTSVQCLRLSICTIAFGNWGIRWNVQKLVFSRGVGEEPLHILICKWGVAFFFPRKSLFCSKMQFIWSLLLALFKKSYKLLMALCVTGHTEIFCWRLCFKLVGLFFLSSQAHYIRCAFVLFLQCSFQGDLCWDKRTKATVVFPVATPSTEIPHCPDSNCTLLKRNQTRPRADLQNTAFLVPPLLLVNQSNVKSWNAVVYVMTIVMIEKKHCCFFLEELKGYQIVVSCSLEALLEELEIWAISSLHGSVLFKLRQM